MASASAFGYGASVSFATGKRVSVARSDGARLPGTVVIVHELERTATVVLDGYTPAVIVHLSELHEHSGRCRDCKHWGRMVDGSLAQHDVFLGRRCEQLRLLTDTDTGGAPDTIGTSDIFGCVLFEPAMPSASEPDHQSK